MSKKSRRQANLDPENKIADRRETSQYVRKDFSIIEKLKKKKCFIREWRFGDLSKIANFHIQEGCFSP